MLTVQKRTAFLRKNIEKVSFSYGTVSNLHLFDGLLQTFCMEKLFPNYFDVKSNFF